MTAGDSLSPAFPDNSNRGPRMDHRGLARRLLAPVALGVTLAACRPSAPPRDAAEEDSAPRAVQPEAGKKPASSPATLQATAPLFTEVAREVGLSFIHESGAKGDFLLPEEMGPGGAFLDYDNDGDMDVYLVQGGTIGKDNLAHRNRLFRNDGRGRFEDVSQGSGADVPGYGMGCAAADYDNDGDVDLYVTRVGSNVLLRNNGDGTFTDVTAEAAVGATGFGTAAAFLDYDRDGLLDLVAADYLDWAAENDRGCYDPTGTRDYCHPSRHGPGGLRLFRNTGSGRFEDAGVKAGVAAHEGNSLGLIPTDVNGDGWVDLYVANDQTPAFLFINQKDGTFQENAAMSGCAFNAEGMAIAGMGTAAEDLDGDGDYDLVITNIHSQPHLALRNDNGAFEDLTRAWGFDGWGVPYTGFGIAFFDQDHDGSLDAYVSNGAVNRLNEPYRPDNRYAEPNQFLRRSASGKFYDASAEAGPALKLHEMSRGAIRGDYDNDGDIDILVTNNRGPVQLLRNENASPGSWVMLDLVAKSGGRNAINARVEVEAGGKVFRREVRPHDSYLASHDPRIHVGLGGATQIERLKVAWPDGTTEEWKSVPVRKRLQLKQGGAPQLEPVGASPVGGS